MLKEKEKGSPRNYKKGMRGFKLIIHFLMLSFGELSRLRVSGEALAYYLVLVLQRYTLARAEPNHTGRLLDFIVLYRKKTIIRSKDSSPNLRIQASQVMGRIME